MNVIRRILNLSATAAAVLVFGLGPALSAPAVRAEGPAGQAAPAFSSIADNRASYAGGAVPAYSRLEITFGLTTSASNPYLPFEASPPPGVAPGVGVTVNAQFTPDNWQTTYTQPAFLFQEFDDNAGQLKSGREWFYPTGAFHWAVRFAPPSSGTWRYRLTAQDAGGSSQSAAYSFTVVPSASHGFVRVSDKDGRYFEFQDGTYFPGLGYNMNWDHVRWGSPVKDNTQNFQVMSQNGIQLARVWLSEWSIFSSAWNPWKAIQLTDYIPPGALTAAQSYGDREVSMKVQADWNRCMMLGDWLSAPPAVKRNTTYKLTIRYKTAGIQAGSLVAAGQPYGFVAKTGGWLWDTAENTRCYYPTVGTPVTPRVTANTADWQLLEGQINSGGADFLPNLYLVMDNLNQGVAYIDEVQVREDLGGGQLGANIVSKPTWNQSAYFDQRQSLAFDKALALAEQNGVYLRPVLLEKNEWYQNHVGYDGVVFDDDARCFDTDPNNDPSRCPSNNLFYGNWSTPTKVRWLQEAWYRYVQARWGYSTAIHSWELLNEGDPFSGLHWAMAEDFGRYMHQFAPNDHLVSTSFWHSFPVNSFWNNSTYPNIDFADVHQYLEPANTDLRLDASAIRIANAADYYDSALVTQKLSMMIGAKQQYGARKPVIRGETGYPDEITNDTAGVWLHNYIWAGINAGGLIESYWYENSHIYRETSPGVTSFDHRNEYGNFYRFISDLPLNKGFYADAAATTTSPDLRAWGQKEQGGGRAHLWIANAKHTWKAVVDRTSVPALTGTVTVPGMRANTGYRVEWWNTYTGTPTRTETVNSSATGALTLSVSGLATDTAVRVTAPALPPGAFKVFTPSVGVGFTNRGMGG